MWTCPHPPRHLQRPIREGEVVLNSGSPRTCPSRVASSYHNRPFPGTRSQGSRHGGLKVRFASVCFLSLLPRQDRLEPLIS